MPQYYCSSTEAKILLDATPINFSPLEASCDLICATRVAYVAQFRPRGPDLFNFAYANGDWNTVD